MKLTILIFFVSLINIGKTFAQDYNFTIHYPLDIDFAASGTEKQEIVELANGNLVMYRFEFDSIAMQHKMRYWSTDPMAIILWDKEFLIGSGDSVFLNGSLCALDNNFILAFTKVLGYGHSTGNIIKCDASGTLLESVQLNIPNDYMIPSFCSVSMENEFVVGGTMHNENGDTSVFVAKSSSQSFQNPAIFTTGELEEVSVLYAGANNELHMVGSKDRRTTDLIFQWNSQAVGKRFPEGIYFRDAIYDTDHGTYYAGLDMGNDIIPDIALLLDSGQGNTWCRRFHTPGQPYYGSTASSLIFHNGKVLVTSYASPPIPTTIITKFDMDGTVEESKRYSSFHSFNYNGGSLLEHSNGHVYFSKLGGVLYYGTSTFTTVLECLDHELNNDCDGITMQYVYDSIPVTVEADTLVFQQSGTAIVYNQVVTNGTMADTILCHTNLGLSEVAIIDAQLYPNPFTTGTTLRLSNGFSSERIEITCSDALGRAIPLTYNVSGENEIQVQFDGSVKGLIIFHLKNGKQEGIIRGIVE